MAELENNFTGETDKKDNPALDVAVSEIRDSLSKQNKQVLQTARLIKRHHSVFPGLQKELAEQLGIDKATFNKYLRIASCGMFYMEEFQAMLPAGLSLLYELALIKNVDNALRNGDVRPDMTRVEIQGLRISYDKANLSWIDAPPLQTGLEAAVKASAKQSSKTKDPKIPKGMCALIKIPENLEQQRAISQSFELMRAAGVVILDAYTRDEASMSKAYASWSAKRDRLVTKAVRAKLKKLKKDFKPTPGKTFEGRYGSPEELALDGTIEGARMVCEHLGWVPEFEDILVDIDKIGGPDFVQTMPSFPQKLENDGLDRMEELGLIKKPKKRDFSDFDFDP